MAAEVVEPKPSEESPETETALETGQVSEAIHKAAAEMEAQTRFSR